MSPMRTITRRFPDYGWAWPSGALDQLIKAVLMPNDEAALQAGLAWLAAHDINDTAFREQRLLAALSDRFGKRLAPSPAHPRLVGLQRLLWSKSRIALRESRESFDGLAQAGIPFMLIKGASRIALDPGAQRGRVSHDIDILVRPQHMKGAFEVLLDLGWQAASSVGPLRLKAFAPTYRAMNFMKGEFGDIDLHQMAYQPLHANAEDEEALWQRSVGVTIEGVAARAPAASDRIALAIAHGALDAHAHSDWLVDVDNTVHRGDVDWDALLSTLTSRNILVPAASALTYLAQEVGTPIPPTVIEALVGKADRQGWGGRVRLLECKPRMDFTTVSAMARGIAKQLRLWRGKRALDSMPQTLWRARIARSARAASSAAGQETTEIKVDVGASAILEVTMQIDFPRVGRRVEMELSTASRHLAVLRYRKIAPYVGVRELTFRGPIQLTGEEDRVFITARPSRFPRLWRGDEDAGRYRALPFTITRVAIRQ